MPKDGAPYREPGKATGLPFPRTGTRRFVFVLRAGAGAAVVVPLMLLTDGNRGVMDAIKMGGPGMWLLLLFVLAAAGVVTALGSMLVRGRRLPVATVVGAALAPMLAAVIVETLVHRQVARALGSDASERGARLRIAFEGMAEETNAPLYAALACGVLLLCAAVASAGVLGTVDYTRLSFRAGHLWLAPLAISLVWLGTGLTWVVSAKAVSGGLSIFELGLFAQLLVIGLAIMSTRASVCLPGWHDAEEAKHIAGALVGAALASSLALVLIDRAVLAFVERHVWDAVSDRSMAASQRARILHEWVIGSRTFSAVTVAHGVGALCSFAPAIVRAHTRGASAVSRSTLVACGLFVVTLVSSYGVTSERAAFLRQHGRSAQIDAVFDEDLPVVHDGAALSRATRNPRVLAGQALIPDGTESSVHSVVAARTMAVALVAAAVDAELYSGPAHEITLELVVRPELPAPAIALDPEIATLVPSGPPVVVVSLSLPIEYRESRRPEVRVAPDGLQVTSALGKRRTVAPGTAHAEELRAAVDVRPSAADIYVVLQREATVQDLVNVMTAFDRGWESVHVRFAPPELPALPKH